MESLADFATNDAAQSSEADKRLFVKFSLQPRLDAEASAREGRDIYKMVEFITILIPGDKTLTVNRPVMPSDRQRFPVQYQRFLNSQREEIEGTLLSTWPLVTETQRRELEALNVKTVEQLAELNDNAPIMGLQRLKQQAQRFLASSKDAAVHTKLVAELEHRDAKIAALESQIEKLASLVEKQATAAAKVKEK